MTLPQGWAATTLGDCQARTTSLDPRRFPDEVFDLFSVPSYSDYVPETVAGSEIGSTKQTLKAGDVLLCKIVPHIRRGWVVPQPTNRRQIGSGEWIVFRDHGLEPEYLRRFVLSDGFHDQFMQTIAGVGGSLTRARPAEAARIIVPVPPLAEQRHIVAKLDALTARLTRARDELDRISGLASRMIEKAYRDAFDCDGELTTLEEVTPSDAPIIYGILQPGPEVADGVPYVRPTEISDGHIKLDALRRTSREIALQYKRATIRPGDIILTIVGSIGKVALVPEALDGGNITQSSCRIRPDTRKIDGEFLRHWLQSPQAWAQYNSGRLGTAVPRLNLRDIREFTLNLPSLSEQRDIAGHLGAIVTRAKRLEAEATRARALLDRLEAAILAKAFRGELVPQDPNDEPASALLDRIRAQRAAAPKAKRGRRRKVSA